jgi:CheY-like chemotaxis protein
MRKRFLLIDDDGDDRALFSEALALVDPVIICDEAVDGQDALARLQSASADKPDMIFLDINLPIMNGWQFLTKLKSDETYRNIPVIMYSTSSNERDKHTAGRLGALCFITKPHAFKLLKNILGVVVTCVRDQRIKTLCNEVNAVARGMGMA